MPEFYPEHTPTRFIESRSERGTYGLHDFMRGYFAAAEWLLDEEIDRAKIRGWFANARVRVANDCKAFIRSNSVRLEKYCEILGDTDSYSAMERAGHDFYLSRNGHGAGYFDRGNDPVFRDLQNESRLYGENYTYVERGYIGIG